MHIRSTAISMEMPLLVQQLTESKFLIPNSYLQNKFRVMIILLLFLQKQNLAFVVYLLGSVLSSPD
jgi:hypothetical protein